MPTRKAMVIKPSSTVAITDGGALAVDSPLGDVAVDSPLGDVAVTPTSIYKPGCWILIRPSGFGNIQATSLKSGNWQDWGGPHLRHSKRSNVGFVDGHVEAMESSIWYYSNTPWTDPAIGGQ